MRQRLFVVKFVQPLIVTTALLLLHTSVNAQNGLVEARVASVSGRAIISGTGHSQFNLQRGVVVNPGDEIDTTGGGRVTLALSDGSMLIIQPGSRVVVQDYRNANSLRELLRITIGRVRIRINHMGGRPNPYRVNSPTASIAVRGTEFSVAVDAAGNTEVVVYEGLVEVSSVVNPGRRVLVQPGRGVIIRANEDIRFFTPGPNNEIGSRNGRRADRDDVDATDDEFSTRAVDGNSLQTAAGVYERYFESIVESGEMPLASKFAAFPDSYFDSLDNPSYATEFRTIEGRIFVVPSTGGTGERDGARELLNLSDHGLVDYSFSPQASFFVPIERFRVVIGGRMASSHDGFQSFTLDDQVRLAGSTFPAGTFGRRTIEGSTKGRLSTFSFIAARRFGSDGRTSIGVGIDHLRNSASLLNSTTQTDQAGLISREFADTRSAASRTRFTIGVTREFRSGPKVGLFYRYGSVSAEDRDRSHTLNGVNRLLNRTTAQGTTSEIGFRLRESISRRLFYGIEGSYLFANTSGRTRRARVVDSNALAASARATIGFGLGYIPRPRTIFSFDASGGVVHVRNSRRERATGNLLEDEKKRSLFISLHAALQADVWRRLFVSGSLLSVTQFETSDLTLYPDRFGRRVTSDGTFEPNGISRDHFSDYFSNLGVGWRFTPHFLAEYIFSTDFGQTSPRHTLLVRYTFNHGGQ